MLKRNLLIFFILLLLFSCSKKSKLSNSSFTILITPNNGYLLPLSETNFKAKVISPNGAVLDKQVTWSVSSGIISNDGKYIAPKIDNPIYVKITATCEDISRTITLRVVNSIPLLKDVFYIYSDEVRNNPYVHKLKFDTKTSEDEDGGFLGVIDPNGKLNLSKSGDFYDGFESLKLDYTDALGGVGIFFQFGYNGAGNPTITKDLSSYNTLNIAFKALRFNTNTFRIEIETTNNRYSLVINPNDYLNWKVIKWKNPAGVNGLSNFRSLLFLSINETTAQFLIDDIYFSNEN